MKPVALFSLQTHAGDYQAWPFETQLLLNNQPTQTYLLGYQLLHQLQLASGEYVLITDWDCPFEEATEVLLLSTQLKLLARHTFAVPYGSYLLDTLQVLDDANLKLIFYQDDCRQVTIAAKKIGLFGSRIKVAPL